MSLNSLVFAVLASSDRGLKRGMLRLLTKYRLVMVPCIYHCRTSYRVYIRLEDWHRITRRESLLPCRGLLLNRVKLEPTAHGPTVCAPGR